MRDAKSSPVSHITRTKIAMIIDTGAGKICISSKDKVISRNPTTDIVKKPANEIVPAKDHIPMMVISCDKGSSRKKLIIQKRTMPPITHERTYKINQRSVSRQPRCCSIF